MQQLEERARHARNSIELSTSVIPTTPFSPPPRRRGPLVIAAILALGGLAVAVGLAGGDELDVAAEDGAIVKTIAEAAGADIADDGAVDEGSEDVTTDDGLADGADALDGVANQADDEPDGHGGETNDNEEADADEDAEADTTTEPEPVVSSGPVTLVLDPALPRTEVLIVPDVVRNAARVDLYGRADADDPFVDGDLEVRRVWNDPRFAPAEDGEPLTIGDRIVYYAPEDGQPARVTWTEADGTRIRVSSYTLERERIVAAATGLVTTGTVDAGGLDLLAQGVSPLLAWSNLPPGATLYRAAGTNPSPGPSLVGGAQVYQLALELGGGADEGDVSENVELGQYAAVLRRRWWLLVAGAVIGVVLARVLVPSSGDTYLATTEVLVRSLAVDPLEDAVRIDTIFDQVLLKIIDV